MSRTSKKSSKQKAKPSEETIESLVEPKSEELSPQEPSSESQVKLARLDPLPKYLLEIGRFEPLTAEEEERLALLYREHDDQEAAYRLITSNLRVVVQIARLYNRVYTNIMDLIQEGNIGLMEAVKRFDPYHGARLPTYASWWIKAYIIKYILDNFRIVRVGTTNERRKLLFNLRKEKEKLRLQGIEPTPALIAQRLKVRPEEVVAVEQAIESSDLSLNAYVDDNQSVQYIDTLKANEDAVDEQLARKELKNLFNREIEEFSRTLRERDKIILHERLIAETPRTLQNIAEQFEVSREAIRLSEKALITKIKEHMQETFKDVTDFELATSL